jgi:disulfide bond formation protein DsbB
MEKIFALLTRKKILVITAVLSALSLSFAYIGEYLFGLEPCILCLYQRVPFWLAIVVSLIGLGLTRFDRIFVAILAVLALLFFTNAGIGAYQVGIEQGWVNQSTGCAVGIDTNKVQDVSDLKSMIYSTASVPCDEIAWSLFGQDIITMALLNLFFSGLVGLALAVILLRFRKIQIT